MVSPVQKKTKTFAVNELFSHSHLLLISIYSQLFIFLSFIFYQLWWHKYRIKTTTKTYLLKELVHMIMHREVKLCYKHSVAKTYWVLEIFLLNCGKCFLKLTNLISIVLDGLNFYKTCFLVRRQKSTFGVSIFLPDAKKESLNCQ